MYKLVRGTFPIVRACVSAKMFGPTHETRRDMAVLSIMRGRDHGLPDYNTARSLHLLPPVTHWSQINPALYRTDPEVSQV